MSLSLLRLTNIFIPFVLDEPVIDVGIMPLRIEALQVRVADFDVAMLRVAGMAASELRVADFTAFQGD